jgi:hypothetical protein
MLAKLGRKAKGRARQVERRGQGHYRGRSPCVRMYGAPATSAGTPRRLRAQEPRPGQLYSDTRLAGGRDGRKSIKKSKIIDTGAADSHIGGNVPYLLSAKGRDTPKDTLTLVVLIAAWLIGVGQSEGRAKGEPQKARPRTV